MFIKYKVQPAKKSLLTVQFVNPSVGSENVKSEIEENWNAAPLAAAVSAVVREWVPWVTTSLVKGAVNPLLSRS